MKQQETNISYKITPGREKDKRQEFTVSIRIPMELGWIDNVEFILLGKRSEHLEYTRKDKEYAYFESKMKLEQSAVYHYCFSYNVDGIRKYHKRVNKTGETKISLEECWKMSVLFKVSNWAKGKVMYQIFVDCFYRSEDLKVKEMPRRHIHKSWNEPQVLGPDEDGIWNNWFYGGNLKGIKEKLSYIKSLGVSIIYLSPIFYSQSNHGYDTSDYMRVDPYKGSNQDFVDLCKEAHKLGMHIVLDAVFNHTGNDSIYYNEYGTFDTMGAYQSNESPYYNFYRRKNGSIDFWWGFKNLPECDGNSKEWQDYIYGDDGVIPYWIQKGADGFRYDVADELTDSFLEGCRECAHKQKKDVYLYGEVWKDPMNMGRGYISSGRCMDSVMNYQLSNALIAYFKECDVYMLKDVCYKILVGYPKDTILSSMNFSSTHDISRIVDIFGFDDKFKDRYSDREWHWDLKHDDLRLEHHKLSREQYEHGKILTQAYLFTLTFWPGNISIFYGDEVGVQGLGNLANRCPFPWDNIDREMLSFVRETVGKTRNRYQFLETAETEVIRIDEAHFVFERYSENQRESILVIVSRKNEDTLVNVPRKYKNAEVIAILRGEREKLGPYGAIALKCR